MKTFITVIFLITGFLSSISCSYEAWYKGSATSHDINCLQESHSEYEECINEERPDYDEYKRATEQLK